MRLGAAVSPLIDAQVAAPAFAASSGTAPDAPFFAGLGPDATQPMLVVPALVGMGAAGAVGASAPTARRRPRVTPITWTGGAAPLLDAVRLGGPGSGLGGLPNQQIGFPAEPSETQPMPLIGSQAGYGERILAGTAAGQDAAYDADYDEPAAYVDGRAPWGSGPEYQLDPRDGGEPVRHAWYPGRRVDLGLVLLPLRIFLGGISIYAGFSKLCDPVYFDGGARGSMMHWLQSLHPWAMAQPLLQLALTHPVGAGLAVAFVQIVVGVLSVVGLWQRLAAGTAMLLALALLLTVAWRTSVPAYDAPEIIYLAAWSPLLLAGAPLFSLDGRLAIEAWHRLGERAPISVLRRRVLRRGFVVGTMVVGATLLVGSALGAAVRNNHQVQTVLPATSGLPTDYPAPIYPTGTPAAAPVGKPKGGPRPTVTPSATTRPAPKHSAPGHAATAPTHHGGGATSTKPKSTHSTPTAGSTKGGNGVIGGLLGSSAPLPLLGMSDGGPARPQPFCVLPKGPEAPMALRGPEGPLRRPGGRLRLPVDYLRVAASSLAASERSLAVSMARQ